MTLTLIDPSSSMALIDEHPLAEARIEDWAACLEMDTSVFFSDDLDDIAAAKRTCLGCPVRRECLDEAVSRGEQYGVWGGHLFVAGRIVLAKRRRGRPPKNPRPNDVFPEVEVPDAYRGLVTASL